MVPCEVGVQGFNLDVEDCRPILRIPNAQNDRANANARYQQIAGAQRTGLYPTAPLYPERMFGCRSDGVGARNVRLRDNIQDAFGIACRAFGDPARRDFTRFFATREYKIAYCQELNFLEAIWRLYVRSVHEAQGTGAQIGKGSHQAETFKDRVMLAGQHTRKLTTATDRL